MRLARFSVNGDEPRTGVVAGDAVVDLARAAPDLPRDLTDLLTLGAAGLDAAARAAGAADARVPLDEVTLLAPVARPSKFLAVGLNYADHVAETGLETPEFPLLFAKMPSCVTGPHDPIERPTVSDRLDYEGELAFVIGRRCRHVSRADAPSVIAGYTIVDDVSVRDWQLRTSQWILGKSFDTHGPMGPWLVTGDELGDPHALSVRTLVNGEVRQESNTRHLIFDCYDLVETLSQVFTLEPGDVVATGTPGGVGNAMDPPRFLAPGDTVRIEIEGIGAIENPVVQEGRAAT
ncbi:MAG TPA: fumarylacetoacetate hydrolase family protein [Capillimicrobium sp.]|nr:fumarylacetoacetate hydrolase family protein [Capillimicrobium sp.]